MMNKKFIILIFLFIYNFSYSVDNIRDILKTQTNFSEQQIANILNLIEQSINSDNIPYNLITLRVKEAVAKKAEYLVFYTTFIKKISYYKIAKVIIDEFYPKISKSDLEYAIQYLSDQIEQGILPYEIIQIFKVSKESNLTIKETCRFLSLIHYAKKNNLSPEVYIEIIKDGISTKKSYHIIKETLTKSKYEVIEKELLKETKEKEIIERQ